MDLLSPRRRAITTVTMGSPQTNSSETHRSDYGTTAGSTKKRLFDIPTRNFVLLLVTPTDGNPLVREYRQPERLRAATPQGDRLSKLPPGPFIGELSYHGIVQLLKDQRKWMTRTERSLVDDLTEYLGFKVQQLRGTNGHGHG